MAFQVEWESFFEVTKFWKYTFLEACIKNVILFLCFLNSLCFLAFSSLSLWCMASSISFDNLVYLTHLVIKGACLLQTELNVLYQNSRASSGSVYWYTCESCEWTKSSKKASLSKWVKHRYCICLCAALGNFTPFLNHVMQIGKWSLQPHTGEHTSAIFCLVVT